MTAGKKNAWVDPLLRPVAVGTITGAGTEITVTPDVAERQRMAKALGLAEIAALTATYRLATRAGGIIKVTGEIQAEVSPVCVLTLEPFPLSIREPVELQFREESGHRKATEADIDTSDDPPDLIENGIIDLGRVTTEFLSLALPPFPRKPGVELPDSAEESVSSPFDGLAGLKPKGRG